MRAAGCRFPKALYPLQVVEAKAAFWMSAVNKQSTYLSCQQSYTQGKLFLGIVCLLFLRSFKIIPFIALHCNPVQSSIHVKHETRQSLTVYINVRENKDTFESLK